MNEMMKIGVSLICAPIVFFCIFEIISIIIFSVGQNKMTDAFKNSYKSVRNICGCFALLGFSILVLGFAKLEFKVHGEEKPEREQEQEQTERIESVSYNDVSANEVRISIDKIKEIRVVYEE